ncbi:ferric reductase-like transmembrane domain-containing protein [Stutzerimonas xanthomarina]|uniref:ferredoxin reductase family protein n=1 Tax=Stutzerimonas xanthomarina TaxID=271420 RepID=UPI003AA87C7D
MQRIRLAFVTLFVIVTLLWLTTAGVVPGDYSRFWPLRADMVHYTGVLSITAMSVAVYLAIRPQWLERRLGGLDKSYRLHKWLGIGALVVSTVHWGWAQIPKWLVKFGWLAGPARRGAGRAEDGLLGWLHAQRGFAEDIGEWAFYLAALLIVLALIKQFPYRWFFKTHRWLALVYLVLVVHSLLLMPPAYWSSPLGVVIASSLIGGTLAACVSLLRQVGRAHQVIGRVDGLSYHPDNQVLRVDVALEGPWSGHKPGQFAFASFDQQEGPHPFSLSSAWQNDGKLSFSIKGLGDYTRRLPQTLHNGDAVTVEGPYGCFDFRGHKPGQIWVAGGIGIAPFISRLQTLASSDKNNNIDLFYCTSAPDQRFIAQLQALAGSARIRLHIQVAAEHGRLTPSQVRQVIPDWRQRDVWFCGPASFGSELRQDLIEHGLPAGDFHQELFNMR